MKQHTLRRVAALLMLSALLLGRAETGAQAQIYVSQHGSDANNGTAHSPLATLAEAQRRVRSAKDKRIILRGGTYRLSVPLTLTAQDSGETWQAYPGETPVLSGGIVVIGWAIHDTAKNIWQASLPDALQDARQIYVNGVRCITARTRSGLTGTPKQTANGYTTSDGYLSTFARPQDLEFVYRAYWTEHHLPVASVSGNTIAMVQPAFTAAQTNALTSAAYPTYIANAYELLGTPGQFYLDKGVGKIYYVPRAGEHLATATVVAPLLQTLVLCAGTAAAPVRNVTLSRLAFADTAWLNPSVNGFAEIQENVYATLPNYATSIKPPAAVMVQGGRAVIVSRCVFQRLGAAGVTMGTGTQRSAVQGCEFVDISGNGIQIGDPGDVAPTDSRLVTADIAVTDNHIHACGVEYHGAVGIGAWYMKDCVFAYNLLHDLPYTGISVGWGWASTKTTQRSGTRVVANLIHDVMQYGQDGGGIYSNSSDLGQIVRGNVVYALPGGQVSGLYLDDGSTGKLVQNNVVYGMAANIIHENNNFGGSELSYNFNDAAARLVTNLTHAPNVFRENQTTTLYPASIMRTAGLEPGFGGKGQAGGKRLTAPRALVLGSVSGNSVPLTWRAPVSVSGSALAGYEVWMHTSAGGDVCAGTTTKTTFTFDDLLPSMTYSFWVRAINAAGYASQASPAASLMTGSGIAPRTDYGAGFVTH